MELLYLLKLKHNISLEGDIELARLEIPSLIKGTIREIYDLDSLEKEIGSKPLWEAVRNAVRSVPFSGTVKAFLVRAAPTSVPELCSRLAMIREVYVFAECYGQSHAQSLLEELFPGISTSTPEGTSQPAANARLTFLKSSGKYLISVIAVPNLVFYEFAPIIARHCGRDEVSSCATRFLQFACSGFLNTELIPKPILNSVLRSDYKTDFGAHGLHIFKAKFFPRMARALLNHCCSTKGTSLDSFVGSGTSTVEALDLGLFNIASDIDPLSVIMTRVKAQMLGFDWTLVGKDLQMVADSLVSTHSKRLTDFPEISHDVLNQQKTRTGSIIPPWLERKMSVKDKNEIVEHTSAILAEFERVTNPVSRQILDLLLSDAISRKLRFRFLGLGVGRFALEIRRESILNLLRKTLTNLARTIEVSSLFDKLLGRKREDLSFCVMADSRFLPLRSCSLDCEVTSPPYLPASSGRESYVKTHAVSMLLLGLVSTDEEVSRIDFAALGSINEHTSVPQYLEENLAKLTNSERDLVTFLRDDPNRKLKAGPTVQYILDIRTCLREAFRVLIVGGKCAIVVATRHTFYRYKTRETVYVLDNAEWFAEEAKSAGFRVERRVPIQLAKRTALARPRARDTYSETILILVKAEQ